MLRLRSEERGQVWLALCPDQVGGVRVGRGGRSGRSDRSDRSDNFTALDPVAFARQGGAAATDAVLAAAAQWLEQHQVAQRQLQVIVSDSLVRYALLPFSATALSAGEEEALGYAKFAELYGDMADWSISTDRQRYGRARVACAMPAALRDGLTALLAQRGCRAAITPFFVACCNRARRARGAAPRQDQGLLAVVGGDSLVLAAFGRAGWSSLRSVYLDGGADIADVLYREKLIYGLAADLEVTLLGLAGEGGHAHEARAASVGMALAGAGR